MRNRTVWIAIGLLAGGAVAALRAQGPAVPGQLVIGQAASIVVGQRNFSDITFGTTAERWGSISGMAIAGNRLIVADSSYLAPPNNNRVLIYNDLGALKRRLPQGELLPADYILGQPNAESSTPGASASRFNQPVGVATDGTRLLIAEWGNNRILIYNQFPTTAEPAANVVIGQSSFTTSAFGAGANQLRRPNSVATDGRRVFIADTLNNRVLIYNNIPTQNGANADVVLGQPNFDVFGRSPAAANRMYDPMSVTTDGQRLVVTDFGNNRVLIYNTIPTTNGASADVVVGQPDFSASDAGNTAARLNFPRYAFSDGTRLVIVDSGNNRILIYNRIPTANDAEADLVIGQRDFTGLLESCAASYFAVPYVAASDGDTLFVADSFNRRVLGFRPGVPLVQSVVNTASFSSRAQTAACAVILPQPPVGPGGLAAIFGENLSSSTAQANDLPLPFELGGVSVKVNGIPAPVYFVSPGQVNIQIPFEVTGFSASLEITRRTGANSVTSVAAPIGLANGAPGIFTRDGNPEGPGVITHADSTPVTEASPATKGEALVAYVTGLGTVDHEVTNGAAAEFGAEGVVSVSGVIAEGDTVTVNINGRTYAYTTRKDDTLAILMSSIAALITNLDPEVKATSNDTDGVINLRARVFGDQGTSITYSARASDGSRLNADTSASRQLPASVSFAGTPQPGQTILIRLAGTAYLYTVAPGDSAEDIVRDLAEQIDGDPNVAATADLPTATLRLTLEDPALIIPLLSTLSDAGTSIAVIPGSSSLVPGSLSFAGPVTPGQTVTVQLQETQYSYTTVAGDTLETLVTRLASVVNNDTNVSATANPAEQSISFALKTPNLNISFSAFVRFASAFRASTGGAGAVPATLTLQGTPSAGQVVRAFVGTEVYSYTVATGDTRGSIATRLAAIMNENAKVSATADAAAAAISLALRGEEETISVSIAVSDGQALRLLTEANRLAPGDAQVINTVSAFIGETLNVVPGTITLGGTPTPGEVITVRLAETPYSYTVASTDTLQTIVTNLAQLISNDLNVTATADTTSLRISLALKDTTSTVEITYRLLTAPNTALFGVGSSTKTTGSTGTSVSFAGLVKGTVGLYQINFVVPSDAAVNSLTKLTFQQNLIIFGSVSEFDIRSNTVTFPVGE